MKLFLALCALSFSAVSMAAPVADRGLGTRKMEEVPEEGYYEEGYTGEGYEADDAVALTDEEIEALFEQDMMNGENILFDPDYESEEGDGRKLRGGGRKLFNYSGNYCMLCKHSNCQGGHVFLGPGRYSSMPWQIGNDALTRVHIPRRHTFTYYEHTNFGGWQRTFGEPDRGVNLFMGGHNDAVSSFIIRRF